MNVSQLTGQRDIVMDFIVNENITVSNGSANITTALLCTSVAAPIRDALMTLASVEIHCGECGQNEQM